MSDHFETCIKGLKLWRLPNCLNPFVPTAPFLYPLKTSENLYDFLIFSGSRERVNWEQMG